MLLVVSLAGTLVSAAPAPLLTKVASFDLPGPGGKRFDYLTMDPNDHYLLSAHLAAGQTYVIDIRTNKVVTTVTDTPGAEGVEYVPELKKFYTSRRRRRGNPSRAAGSRARPRLDSRGAGGSR